MIRKFATLLFIFLFTSTVTAQVTADPAYWNMQRAMGGIMQQAAQTRGYSQSDPRTYGSLYGIGRTAATTAAVAGTGLLVVGTSPGWGTVLAFAAISAGVTYAINLGLDNLIQWQFASSTSANPVTMTMLQSISTSYVPSNGESCIQVSNVHNYCSGIGQPYVPFSACLPVSNPLNPTCGCSESCRSGQLPGIFTQPYPTTLESALQSRGFTQISTTAPLTTSQTMAQQALAMSESQKSQPINYKTLAFFINELWKKSATSTDYAGIPYLATQPITETEVQVWAQANPQAYPTVAALLAPVSTSTATATAAAGFQLATSTATSSATSTGTAPQTASSTTPATGTNAGQANPVTNLGVDPNIIAPALENTPTAQMIMDPILKLFPTFKNYSVPSHNGQCPKPSFSAFSKTFVLQSHCSLLEDNRTALSNAMLLVFALAALFIVFSA